MKKLINQTETSELREKGKRESHESKGSEEVPPLAEPIRTLPEAVSRSLKGGLNKDSLFILCRALRAFAVTTGTVLVTTDLDQAFAEFWRVSEAFRKPSDDFEEFRFVFRATFVLTRVPLGGNPLEEAIKRAKVSPEPPEVTPYKNSKIRFLISVCWQLQLMADESPFFLSTRCAGRILGSKDNYYNAAILKGLVIDKILEVAEPGKPGGSKATRYRFIRSGSPMTDPRNQGPN